MTFRKILVTSWLLICNVQFTGNHAALCGNHDRDYFPPSESEGGWRKNTDPGFIRLLGIDPDKLEDFGQYNLSVENGSWMPYSQYKGIIVVKDGWIIGEWYNIPEARDFKTYISSNGKSFAMTAFGIMMQDARFGKIDVNITPESPVYNSQWLPEGFPLSNPKKSQITFEHIFQHTSGLCPERTASGEEVEKGRNAWTNYIDWVVGRDKQWPQTVNLYFTPGHPEEYRDSALSGSHRYAYSSVGFCHIGLVLKNVYGMESHEFLNKRIGYTLGMNEIEFHAPPEDDIRWFSAGGVRICPRDYARFAYLLLRDGRWGDRQIVDASWVQRFRTSNRYPNMRSNIDGIFGAQYPGDMFLISGSGLNWAFIIPSLDLIALRTSRANNDKWNEVQQTFLEKMLVFICDVDGLKSEYSPYPGSAQYLPHQILVDPDHPGWLKRNDGTPFFLCGPGDPEGFLYRGLRKSDGTRDDDQAALIDKLKGTGANCIYLMAIRSHGGDGDDTENPFIMNNPELGVNMSVLEQWETWFEEMDRNDIVIFFIFYDDSALVWDTGDEVGLSEKDFISTMVNRFEHHDNLIWCIAEEYQEKLSHSRVKNIARIIREADDHDHAIAVHKNHGIDFTEFADDPDIDLFAVQYNVSTSDSLHDGMVKAAALAHGRYSLIMSEAAGHGFSDEARRKSWASAMGGAYVMVLGMDVAESNVSDLEDCGRLVSFFESTDFYTMSVHDELRYGGTHYVLADPGKSYIAYASGLDNDMGIKYMESGTYSFLWYDCVTGKRVILNSVRIEKGNRIWTKPVGIGNETALYIKRIGN